MEFQEMFGEKEREASPSSMAEGIALHRFAETMLPEDVRILSDPYAVHFLDPVKMAWAMEHPSETRQMAEEIERKMPGLANAIRSRIRYFDDIVQDAPGEGFSQLVILGAGYDTRTFRIDSLKGRMRIFEIDRHDTQVRKTGIIMEVFGELPDNVAYIPLDMTLQDCWGPLLSASWSPREKTLFLLEGLVMYLPRPAVEDLLAGIAAHAGVGSTVLFDFMPQSLADGSSEAEGGQNIREWTEQIGEPILSGFADDEIVPFLTGIGYSVVSVIPSRELGKRYYTGRNADRKVSGLMSVAFATVPERSRR